MRRRVFKAGGGKGNKNFSYAIVIPKEEIASRGVEIGDFVDIEIREVIKK